MIEKVWIQKEESANKITRRAWLRVVGGAQDYDVVLQQNEFQGFLVNEDIKEFVHVIRTIKKHRWNVEIPIMEDNNLVFSGSARLEKAGAPVISNLGGGLKDMLNEKFSNTYVPPEPRAEQVVVPVAIDEEQWAPLEPIIPEKQKRQSLPMTLGSSRSSFVNLWATTSRCCHQMCPPL